MAVAESTRKSDIPANTMALGLLAVVVVPLVLQPDFGQTMLIALVWGALFFMAGMRMIWGRRTRRRGGGRARRAYYFVPHVTKRINRFMDPASGDTYQVSNAMESFVRGGWFRAGAG